VRLAHSADASVTFKRNVNRVNLESVESLVLVGIVVAGFVSRQALTLVTERAARRIMPAVR
jgi:hypothetical protein